MKERNKNDRKSRCWPEEIQRTTLKQDPRSRFLQLFKFTNRDMNGFSKLSSARKMKLLFGMIAKFKWLLIWSHSHIFRSARMRSVFSGGSLLQSARCLLSTYFRQCSCSVRKTFGSHNHSIPAHHEMGKIHTPAHYAPLARTPYLHIDLVFGVPLTAVNREAALWVWPCINVQGGYICFFRFYYTWQNRKYNN